ncbi:hypothetical protein [Bradyrhizobium japonicum]|uniref:hypothetical protein n=1 Tax=Bradyrhizobium japonicum TaxID=375 RepID=UPI001BA6DBA5|nr:hypothetical protein [Bradyrhizobium japonicum]MBR0911499.1 hypothetical protein [Bradyrhizobium japonicum]
MTTHAEDLTLKLVGYASHTTHGFTLPLFGRYDRANTLYVAACSPSGDHDGTISRFDAYEPGGHAWLSVERPDPVRIGDAWLDVFLWNDQVYIGDAQTLWTQLAPIRAELEQLAPLSLLDAAMHAASPERDRLAPIAMSYVTNRFGVDRANQWREGTLRRHVSVLIRRVAPEFQETPASAESALCLDTRSLQLKLPQSLLGRLRRADALQPLIDDARRLAASFNLDFELLDSNAHPGTSVAPVVVPSSDSENRSDQDAGLVLILTIGRRAREIARHITEPAWLPMDVVTETLRKIDATEIRSSRKIIQIVDADAPRPMEKLAAAYEVVAVVVDETLVTRDGLPTAYQTLLERTASLSRAVRILVPALPETHPSRILADGDSAAPLLREWNFHALLDTAQARSPFWWGNPKRSLDRRVADIISGAACLCLSRRLGERTRSAASSDRLMVFAVDLEGRSGMQADPQESLGSESTWLEPGQRGEHARFSNFKHSVEVRERDGVGTRRALIEFRPKGGFEGFALAVINNLFSSDENKRWRFGEDSTVPAIVRRALQFPQQTFALSIVDRAYTVLVTAETPTLDALVAANRSGWRVARYTDRATLRSLMNTKDELDLRNVPGEVALGSIATSEINRKLATRGVDTRDIIRLNPDQLHEWLDRVSSDERRDLQREIRPLRTSGDRSITGDPPAVAVRRKKLLEERSIGDLVLEALGKVLRIDPRELTVRRPYKRAADLDVCWADPADGFMRFAIADGEIPPMMVPLRPAEVVLQSFFIVDGDWSVPALFRSRIFAVWAAATLSRSSSWMSRFSLGATFAGFPVPSRFQIVETSSSAYALRCEDGELLALAKDVESHVERIANAGTGSSWKSAQRSPQLRELPSAKRLDDIILSAYDLPPNADDLSILRRIVEMNGNLAAR